MWRTPSKLKKITTIKMAQKHKIRNAHQSCWVYRHWKHMRGHHRFKAASVDKHREAEDFVDFGFFYP
jgi:hypothetical protein